MGKGKPQGLRVGGGKTKYAVRTVFGGTKIVTVNHKKGDSVPKGGVWLGGRKPRRDNYDENQETGLFGSPLHTGSQAQQDKEWDRLRAQANGKSTPRVEGSTSMPQPKKRRFGR